LPRSGGRWRRYPFRRGYRGRSCAWERPIWPVRRLFLASRARRDAGWRRGGGLVSAGAIIGVVCESVLARGARPRVRGKGPEGGAGGNRGKPRALGGGTRVSPATLAGFHVRQAPRGMRRRIPRRPQRPVWAYAARSAAPRLSFPRSWGTAGTGVHPDATVMGGAGSVVVFGEWGLGE